jgi:hypothetical protein
MEMDGIRHVAFASSLTVQALSMQAVVFFFFAAHQDPI